MKIQVALVRGKTPAPQSLNVRTRPGHPKEPTDFKAIEITSKSFNLTWSPPFESNGEFDHYLLEVTKLEPLNTTIKLFVNQNYYLLEELQVFGSTFEGFSSILRIFFYFVKANTQYIFKIQACNKANPVPICGNFSIFEMKTKIGGTSH